MTDFAPALALRSFEYWIFQYKRTWRGSVVSTVLFDPVPTDLLLLDPVLRGG